MSIFGAYVSNYFDDFVALAASAEVESVAQSVTLAFKLLGWIFAETGEKAPPFSISAPALGVVLDVSLLRSGSVTIDNTPNRKLEIRNAITRILEEGKLGKQDALKLRGRLQFMSGQIFGRVSKKCLAVITSHAYSDFGPVLSTESKHALALFLKLISMDVPREVSLSKLATWFLFTDACYEPDDPARKAGVGAVLVNNRGVQYGFFSHFLDDSFLERMNVAKRRTIIFECELLAIFLAMLCWKQELTGAQVVCCTDNDGVKDCLISCQTSSSNSVPILHSILQMEFDMKWNSWFSRVPTESNIADPPSRGKISELLAHGVHQYKLDLEAAWSEMLELARGEAETSTSNPVLENNYSAKAAAEI